MTPPQAPPESDTGSEDDFAQGEVPCSLRQSEFWRNETLDVRAQGASLVIGTNLEDELAFQATEMPAWRDDSALLPPCSQMLTDLRQWIHEYQADEQNRYVQQFMAAFRRHMAACFIFYNNIAEGVGPDEVSTQQLLESRMLNLSDEARRPVLQMFNAMEGLHGQRVAAAAAGKPTAERAWLESEQIYGLHREMMEGLMTRPGLLRESAVGSTVPGGGRFWFDPPHLLKSSLQLCIDVYQALLDEVDKQGNDLALFFNLAAWLMLHMVTLHPFDDGNGRLSRLLANHVLSAVFPFPIPALLDGSQRRRAVYVEALMSARDCSDPKLTRAKPPSDYAALLIECAWICWQKARQELNRCKDLGRLRGKLFGNKFTHERYLQLDDINLSPEEMVHEENTICKSIQERLALANQHRYKTESFEVPLSHGTRCMIYLRHSRNQE